MNEASPSCAGPFGGIQIEYPVHFDLRIIYAKAEAPKMASALESALARLGIPCSIIQGTAKPEGRYGRMGARVIVDSKQSMDKLYAEVSGLPGVRAVI